MRIRAIAIALAMGLVTPAMAQTDDTVEQVENLAAQARVHYDQGDYVKAVAVYLEAYKLQPTAAVLYNVAVIYDKKLQEDDLAIDFYRRYIGSPDADPAAVQRATARVQELKAKKEAKRQADLATLGDDPSPGGNTPPPPPPPVEPMSGQAVAGYVILGTGLAAVAAGAVMGVLASDAADDFKNSIELDEKKDFRDTAEGRALVADIAMGVGGAAVIGGVLLLVLDGGDEPEATGALRVGPSATGLGLSVGGAW